jgi:hypothetical protein
MRQNRARAKRRLLVTDGSFAATREQIGGFILTDGKHIDKAIQLASRIPSVRLGEQRCGQ